MPRGSHKKEKGLVATTNFKRCLPDSFTGAAPASTRQLSSGRGVLHRADPWLPGHEKYVKKLAFRAAKS